MNIIKFDFGRLHKLEFADMAKGMIEIVQKYDLEKLNIVAIAQLLIEQQPELEKIIVSYGKHPVTARLSKLRLERSIYLRAIVSHLSAIEAVGMVATGQYAKLVVPFTHRMLDKIYKANDKECTERVHQFLAAINADSALNEAFISLGFETQVSETRRVQNEIDELVRNRVSSLSERPKLETDKIKRSVSKTINMLFWRIELAVAESGTPAIYDALINELNEWMISYRLLVKSRITRAANRKVSDETGSDKTEAVAMSAKTSATA